MRLPACVTALVITATLVVTAQSPLTGRVVAVADGDTITVLDEAKRQHRIRLNGIDAPETGQPFANVSKQHLSDLVFGKDVVVVGSKLDRYGRLVGTVIVGSTNANLELLRAGLAWYYRAYASDVAPENRPIYEATEAEAMAAQRGLWRDSFPQAPWDWRGGQPAPIASAPTTTPTQASRPAPRPTATARIIGNRNSNIYHAPGCPDYNRVAERNRIYFNTEAEARAAGFRKARNC